MIAVAVLLCAAAILATGQKPVRAAAPGPGSPSIWGLHVAGNQLLNGQGRRFRPAGVDRSGAEYPCVGGWGIWDGPVDQAAVAEIAQWHANTVRVPLNEDCWLGINGVDPALSGANYRQAIEQYVSLLNQDDIAVVLDLHWNAAGAQQSTGQQPMPDLDHAPAFWTSVANTFKANSSVMFDLYNEPFTTSWACWRDGSIAPGSAPCTDVPFAAAGMQTLVDAVRATGARNVILLGGLRWANDLTQWLAYQPNDPLHQVAASFHVYNWNQCIAPSCFDSQLQPVMDRVPLVATEMGEGNFAPAGIVDCGQQTFVDDVMNWLDLHGGGYLAWAWVPYGCGFPSLLSDWNGTASGMGQGVLNRLTALAAAGFQSYASIANGGGTTAYSVEYRTATPLEGAVVTMTLPAGTAVSVTGAGADPTLWQVSVSQTADATTVTFAQRAGTTLPPNGGYLPLSVRSSSTTSPSSTGPAFAMTATPVGSAQQVTDQGLILAGE